MKQSLASKTCLIIRKHGEYFVGWNYFYKRFGWSTSAWDAWRTRDREAARRVAAKTGGTLYLFNPIIGEMKIYAGG